MLRASFHVFVGHLYVSFGEMSPKKVFHPFSDCVVCFSDMELQELLVYFGDKLSVSLLFKIIFSHSEGCLFILFISFAVQKLVS